jgi:hypothetical protein
VRERGDRLVTAAAEDEAKKGIEREEEQSSVSSPQPPSPSSQPTLPILRIAEAAKEVRSPCSSSSSPTIALSPAIGAYMCSVATSMHALFARTPSCSCSMLNTRCPTTAPSDTDVPLPATEGATRGSEESAGARGREEGG